MSDQNKHQSAKNTAHNKKTAADALQPATEKLMNQVTQLQDQLQAAEQKTARAQADYQNLKRRTEQEKQQIYQTAAKLFIVDLLEPLEQLHMAARQLNDAGLNMVLDKLGKTLDAHGLQPIEVLGQPFDIETMDCVEVEDGIDAENGVVTKELRTGYRLGDEVIQHAQVTIGAPK